MDADQQERYVRWQDYRITQLSFSISLFLGFAVASLGFIINLRVDGRSHSTIGIESTILWWAAGAALGCIATLSRLLDYRHTAEVIKDGSGFNAFMAKYCGPVTWGCFWAQVITYALGAYVFIVGIVRT
jgi:hypothetical protein